MQQLSANLTMFWPLQSSVCTKPPVVHCQCCLSINWHCVLSCKALTIPPSLLKSPSEGHPINSTQSPTAPAAIFPSFFSFKTTISNWFWTGQRSSHIPETFHWLRPIVSLSASLFISVNFLFSIRLIEIINGLRIWHLLVLFKIFGDYCLSNP